MGIVVWSFLVSCQLHPEYYHCQWEDTRLFRPKIQQVGVKVEQAISPCPFISICDDFQLPTKSNRLIIKSISVIWRVTLCWISFPSCLTEYDGMFSQMLTAFVKFGDELFPNEISTFATCVSVTGTET